MDKQQVLEKLKNERHQLNEFNVDALYLFGSIVKGGQNPQSDVDILVEFEPDAKIGFFTFVRLQKSLEIILGCKVDLTTREALNKHLKDKILKESVRAA